MDEFSRWYSGLTKGTRYSALLHFCVIVFLLFGAPMLFSEFKARENSVVVLVDLPVRDITNVKTEAPEKSKPKEKPKPKPEPKEEKPKDKKPEPKPEPKKEAVPLPDAKPKPKEKTPEKKPEKKPDAKKQPDFDDILKDLAKQADEEKKKQPEKTFDDVLKGVNAQGEYNPALPMSVSQLDAIRSQIQRCWNVPSGVKDDYSLVVVLRMSVERNGVVTAVDYENKSRYNSDAVYRAAVDSAVRAVRTCSPLKNLPLDKYDSWREMELTFDPKDMLY